MLQNPIQEFSIIKFHIYIYDLFYYASKKGSQKRLSTNKLHPHSLLI